MTNVISLKQATDASGLISGLLLPVENMDLLLPNVSVAEVVDYQRPQPDSSKPDWFMGTISWRGLSLPVVSFERMNGQSLAERGVNPRVVVINAIGPHHEKQPFFAFITQTIPRLIKVDEEAVSEEAEEEKGPAEKMRVSAQGELAVIPDLEFMEQQIFTHCR